MMNFTNQYLSEEGDILDNLKNQYLSLKGDILYEKNFNLSVYNNPGYKFRV